MHHYGPNKMPSECLTYDRIRAELPSIFPVLEDAGDRIDQLKSVKTSREVGKLKLAHQVVRAERKSSTSWPSRHSGNRSGHRGPLRRLRQAASLGIDYVFCEMPQITSGPERTGIADTLSNHPTARRLQPGDPVLLELGAHAEGYWADITRAAVVGEPTALLRRLHQAVLDAQAAAIARYVPRQSTGEQLCEASWQAMREAGFEQGITHFLGHGLGFAYHEDRPTLGPGEDRPVLPGQVSSIEPGLYWRDGSRPVAGIRVEETWCGVPGPAKSRSCPTITAVWTLRAVSSDAPAPDWSRVPAASAEVVGPALEFAEIGVNGEMAAVYNSAAVFRLWNGCVTARGSDESLRSTH